MFMLAAAVGLFYGVYGYFVEAIVRIGFSVYQVAAVLVCIVGVTVIDVFLGRGAESRGEIRWGQMPERSQYALFVIAVTFTWLMGLMGFARSGIRQHWRRPGKSPSMGQAAAPRATGWGPGRPTCSPTKRAPAPSAPVADSGSRARTAKPICTSRSPSRPSSS